MKFTFIFALIVFMVSCTKNSEPISKIIIPNDSTSYEGRIGEKHIDKIEIIALETNKESILPNRPKSFFLTKSRVIFSDWGRKASVWIFDKQGKFVNRIKALGEGPNEYAHLRNVSVDTHRNAIKLFADYKRSIINYNFNGDVLYEETAGRIYDFILPNSDGSYFLYVANFTVNPEMSEVLYKSAKGGYTPLLKKGRSSDSETMLNNNLFFNDRVHLFVRTFCDTIFQITPKTLTPYRIINFKSNALPKDINKIVQENRISKLEYAFNHDHPFIQDYYFEDQKYIYVSYMYQKQAYFYLFDKKNNQIITNSSNVFIEPLGISLPAPNFCLPEGLVFIINPFELKRIVSNIKEGNAQKGLRDNLLNYSKSLKDDDNPILITIKLN